MKTLFTTLLLASALSTQAEAHHAVADGDMAHVADGDHQQLVGTMM